LRQAVNLLSACRAVICEEDTDVAAFADFELPADFICPVGDFAWQAYVKQGMGAAECSNS